MNQFIFERNEVGRHPISRAIMNFYPELPNWSVSIPQRHIYIITLSMEQVNSRAANGVRSWNAHQPISAK